MWLNKEGWRLNWKVAILRCVAAEEVDAMKEAAVQLLREVIEGDLHGEVLEVRRVAGQLLDISAALYELVDYHRADLVLTVGGIGLDEQDVMPEATMQVVDRTIPGIAEALRAARMGKDPQVMLQRGVAGVKGSTLIVNLPSDANVMLENIETILPALARALKILQPQRGAVAPSE